MKIRPLKAIVKSVKEAAFKPIKSHQNTVISIGYNFCWKTVKKYINESGVFFRVHQLFANFNDSSRGEKSCLDERTGELVFREVDGSGFFG
jgi:hypothetical protein